MADAQSTTEFATAAGISVSYASELLTDTRRPSLRLAIDIYRRTGRKFGDVKAMTEETIDAMDRHLPPVKLRGKAAQVAA